MIFVCTFFLVSHSLQPVRIFVDTGAVKLDDNLPFIISSWNI